MFSCSLTYNNGAQQLKTQQHIVCVTFDVSVDDHVAVQVRDPLQDLPGVAARHVFRQRSVRLQLVLDGSLRAKKVRREPNLSLCHTSDDKCWQLRPHLKENCPSVIETWLLDTFHIFAPSYTHSKHVYHYFYLTVGIRRALTPGMYSMKMESVRSMVSRRQP